MKTSATNQRFGKRGPLQDHPKSLGVLSIQQSFFVLWAPFAIPSWFQNWIPCAQRAPLSCLLLGSRVSTLRINSEELKLTNRFSDAVTEVVHR